MSMYCTSTFCLGNYVKLLYICVKLIRCRKEFIYIKKVSQLLVEYEPKSFILSNGLSYRPDFYIHDTDEWIEVKGRWINEARRKFNLFKSEYPEISIKVIGPKLYKKYITEYSGKVKMEN